MFSAVCTIHEIHANPLPPKDSTLCVCLHHSRYHLMNIRIISPAPRQMGEQSALYGGVLSRADAPPPPPHGGSVDSFFCHDRSLSKGLYAIWDVCCAWLGRPSSFHQPLLSDARLQASGDACCRHARTHMLKTHAHAHTHTHMLETHTHTC